MRPIDLAVNVADTEQHNLKKGKPSTRRGKVIVDVSYTRHAGVYGLDEDP